MIKATLREALNAHRALQRIGETKLPAKSAWRVGRLISKLRPISEDYQKTQQKLILDHGGVRSGIEISLAPPVRNGEDEAAFGVLMSAYRKKVQELNDAMEAVLAEAVEVDYDPIPLALFEPDADHSAQLAPNDLSGAGPFIKE